MIGWGNLSVKDGELKSEFGYVASQPRERDFKRELEAELDRMRTFLDLDSWGTGTLKWSGQLQNRKR